MKRIWIAAAVSVAVVAAASMYVPLNFLRPGVERVLGRGLGRRVEIGNVYLTAFPAPGFSLEGVTIHEDPRAGIEPFAYVQTLEARVAPLGLLRGRVNFSSLRFGDASLNLVKTDEGPWNFQSFLARAAAGGASGPPSVELPSIKMRAGRVNFKFGQTKSVLFFDDADVDVSPGGGGSMELRFSGVPSRTDRSAQNFGHFFLRGASAPSAQGQKMDLNVQLEPSALDAVAHLFAPGGYAAPGVVALQAQITGVASRFALTGELQLDQRGGRTRLPYRGALDLASQTLDLESAARAPNEPLSIRLHAADLLSSPQWEATAEFHETPLAIFLSAARRLGALLPEKLSGEGALSGSVNYRRSGGLSGDIEVRGLSLSMPGAPAVKAVVAAISIGGNIISAGPAKVSVGEDEIADVELNYGLGYSGLGYSGLDLKITTRDLDVADLHSLGLGDVPLLDQISRGSWRGWARYRKRPSVEGVWSGEYELRNAWVAIDGLADSVRIQSASVSAYSQRVSVARLTGRAGNIEFTGDYRWDPDAASPHQFHLQVETADLQELARLWAPTLARGEGFLARTLRFGGPAPAPDWLTQRQAQGTLAIQALNVGDYTLSAKTARLLWDGLAVTISGIDARLENDAKLEDATLAGDLSVDLTGSAPRYRLEGKLDDFAYKGGSLDFSGKIESAGLGLDLLSNVQAEGSLRGRGILFSPEAEFRSVTGRFEMKMAHGGPRWKLSDLDLIQGGETYSGEGTTQPDGRLVLELASRGRQVRYTGTMFALVPQP
ncbi:MAG TPA: AsmA family protein [Bryobacteraceae bacterium]|nr:AsmA family protein [Bryobacteraceae bacterium]